MMVEKVDVMLTHFDAHFELLFGPSADGDSKVKLMLFLASHDPSSTLTWCPGKT
jgi:hypothetical protein